MADETPAVTPGKDTSEFSFHKFVLFAGALVTSLGAVLEVMSQLGWGAKWVGVALMALGLATKVLTAFGWTSARTSLKSDALAAAAFSGDSAAKSLGPDVDALLDSVLAKAKRP